MKNILVTYDMTRGAREHLTANVPGTFTFHTRPAKNELQSADVIIGEPSAGELDETKQNITLITLDQKENYRIPAFSFYDHLIERASDWMLASILEHVFRFPEYIAAQKQCDWAPLLDSSLRNMVVISAADDQISHTLADRLKVFGCEVRIVPGIDDDSLRSADVLCLHVLANDPSYCALSAEMLKKMKNGALLINCGCGAAVNEDDLVSVLHDGHYLHACIDQTQVMPLPRNHPLWSLDSVRLTPQTVFNPSSPSFLSFIEKTVSQESLNHGC